MAKQTSDSRFEKDVLRSEVPVLVDFWASWCFPCRMNSTIVDKVEGETGTAARVFRIDVDRNPETASKYGIKSVPTVVLFSNGKVARQFVGIRPVDVYLNAVSQVN